ncbi:helix-turn-helix transcriptional regulator [Agilicoccus flavus]|uniref:helix-turn-helix transcriptional regulator n=1 Tax=Agilicoccus flavus TaxID=2775968 RepID=UPI001CF6D1B1|nr:WYL domain-containing protein [Agilicoccus flavus]
MSDPTVRVLRLLTLLQEHAVWTGPDLAERLGVSVRGVRRDVERLRELGYPVRSERGAGGGYRLAAGGAMPPLVLDDDEAVAIAVSLSLGAGGTVEGVGEACVRALAKLDQVVPKRLRERIAALSESTVRLEGGTSPVDAGLLTGLARACRDHVQVRVAYRKQGAQDADERRLEPYRLVATGRRWYLLAFDLARDDWRVFRLDRMADLHATTFRFAPRPAPDAAERVARGTAVEAYRWRAALRVEAPPETVRAFVPPTQVGVEEIPGEPEACLLRTGADELGSIVVWLGMLPWPMSVLEPPELLEELIVHADRLRATAGAAGGAGPGVASAAVDADDGAAGPGDGGDTDGEARRRPTGR